MTEAPDTSRPESPEHVSPSRPEGDVTVRDLVRLFPGGGGVNGLSLTADKGQLISLLGASGCGKTTTLRCLAGIETPSAGEIWIDGELVCAPARKVNRPPERRDIGMVFQSYALWPHLTALENVAFPLRARGTPRRQARTKAQAMLEIVGLGRMADRSPERLSGGQQQRVALARALVYQPKLLLFDEPLSNLDAELRESVRNDIRRIQRELGVTALYVTHDRTEAMALSDRLLIMSDGQLIQDGSPRDLLANPASPFVASLLGSANMVPGVVERAETNGADTAITLRTGPAEHPVTIHCRAQTLLKVGSRAVACIRPTSWRIAKSADTAAGAHSVDGRIRDTFPTGPEFEHLVEIGGPGGPVVKIVTGKDHGLDVDDQIRLTYSADEAICFADPGSGAALQPGTLSPRS